MFYLVHRMAIYNLIRPAGLVEDYTWPGRLAFVPGSGVKVGLLMTHHYRSV